MALPSPEHMGTMCNNCFGAGCDKCSPAARELLGRKDLEQYKPKVPRPGTQLLAYSPEPVVGLLEFKGDVIVATSGGVWILTKDAEGNDVFTPISFAARPEKLGIE